MLFRSPKPDEFGAAGMNWSMIGWKVDVKYVELSHRIRPSDHISALRRYLPEKYSPLSNAGRGSQSVYLTEISERLFNALARLIGSEIAHILQIANSVARKPGTNPTPAEDVVVWEEHLRQELERDVTINETEREAIVLARRGQGLFRRRVSELEARCRVTRVSEPEHLRASHCKPWRDSSNEERLDGENGLLLTPSIDHLFDRGFISFEDNGRLLISPVAHNVSLQKMGVKTDERIVVGGFSAGQRKYLEYHRESVFLQARRRLEKTELESSDRNGEGGCEEMGLAPSSVEFAFSVAGQLAKQLGTAYWIFYGTQSPAVGLSNRGTRRIESR